ncbi:hypothetical protein B0H16DRAFT_1897006 [Mycena metata]|uniref:Uncharacterized protein n=1 Tax=Mycena metata TaxID=1033252 RepID=A0AAD7HGZ7_9AGAR|nr:hypothetical protein B0H16DRAFT_1897006 [Mycena metata]
MSLQTLIEFLSTPAPPGVADPPALPPTLDNLPTDIYVKGALAYIDAYPFERTFIVFDPQQKTSSKTLTPNPAWQERSRAVLKACVSAERTRLAPLSSDAPYHASEHQLNFVREYIINRRWSLEEAASEMRGIIAFVRSKTRTPSAAASTIDTSVVEQVRARDGDKCRLTGVELQKEGADGEDQIAREAAVATALHVVHGLPFKIGKPSFTLLEALTGIDFSPWVTDCVENAFYTLPTIHDLFAAFKMYFECVQTAGGEQIIIRGRPGADASPVRPLNQILNDKDQKCSIILDQALHPPHDTSIADIDPKFFILHRYVGDIHWMSGGPEPVPDEDEDEDDDEDVKVLSESNMSTVMEMLRAPEVNWLPREREGFFAPRMELVHKDQVWLDPG